MPESSTMKALDEAARLLEAAARVLVSTGAGMSADSGVPTYRDADGMWRDFSAFTSKGLSPAEIAHLDGYQRDPHQAWGFHEYIRRIIRAAEPHEGYEVVTRWVLERWPQASFVLTTNIDGFHRDAGVPEHQLWERYGSIWELSCVAACQDEWWPEPRAPLHDIDHATMKAVEIPRCPFCGGPARPRTQLANDPHFLPKSYAAKRYETFIDEPVDVYVVIGTTLWFSWPDEVAVRPRIISINPSSHAHAHYDDPIAIMLGARDALMELDLRLA